MKKSSSHFWCCFGIGLGVLIGATDWSIVQNALPAIQSSMGASIGELQWIMNSFGLFMTAFLVTMGKLGDLYGRRRIFTLGLIIFALSCLGAALSPNPFWLITARAFQGIGFAMLMPTSQALLTHAFPENRHGKAMGIWATVAGLGLVLGPVIGGVIVSFFSWKWIFYINIPFAILSYLLSIIFVDESKNEAHPPGLDIKGIILFTLGLGSLIFAIIEAPVWGWHHPLILSGFALALIFLVLFYRIEKRTEDPLIEFSFFKNRQYAAGALSLFTGCFLFWTTFFLLPLYLQNYMNKTPWASGLILLSIGVPFTVVSHFSGSAGDRIDKGKLIPAGLLLTLFYALLFIFTGSSLSILLICIGLVSFGVGQALLWAPGTSLGISALPRDQSGIASGVLTTIQETGGSIGIAIAGTLFRMTEQGHFKTLTKSQGIQLSKETIYTVQSLLSRPQKLDAFLREKAPTLDHRITELFRESFLFGFHSSMVLVAALALIGMVTIFCLLKKSKKS